MILKILLKIWPALTPIFLYIIWNFIVAKIIMRFSNKKDYIDANYQNLNDKAKKDDISLYSLKNKKFIFVIYLSLIFLIISFLSFALQ
ncbi:hypothetical protein N8772_01555 [Rickettsiales bacterium]|nr:hypothetical protein [Rickettsiales bacterium]MDB2550735.1 hypothetical protein [Rickettsiales bacterium]